MKRIVITGLLLIAASFIVISCGKMDNSTAPEDPWDWSSEIIKAPPSGGGGLPPEEPIDPCGDEPPEDKGELLEVCDVFDDPSIVGYKWYSYTGVINEGTQGIYWGQLYWGGTFGLRIPPGSLPSEYFDANGQFEFTIQIPDRWQAFTSGQGFVMFGPHGTEFNWDANNSANNVQFFLVFPSNIQFPGTDATAFYVNDELEGCEDMDYDVTLTKNAAGVCTIWYYMRHWSTYDFQMDCDTAP